MLIALSTGRMIGLGLAGAIFITFALLSSFVFPRSRANFPGKGLPAFVVTTVLLFAGMITAVVVFGAEGEAAGSHGPAAAVAEPESDGAHPEVERGPARTSPGPARLVNVRGTEFAFELPDDEFAPATYTFKLRNTGKVDHNLVVRGPGVDDTATPVIAPGETGEVTVALVPGTYEVYCSVPGHEEAGMTTELTVASPS